MKILVIQLARFGDTLQTAPAINALKRTYPQAKVDMLVRQRFSGLTHMIDGLDEVKIWDTESVLTPILNDVNSILSSIGIMEGMIDELKNEGYDRIVNCSFSPFSSYLCSLIDPSGERVVGYTRFSDGFLSIPDETSRYFNAQIGIDRPNRVHLVDVFAAMMDVELQPVDRKVNDEWLESHLIQHQPGLKQGGYVLFHIGASQEEKSLSVFKWKQVIRKLHKLGGDDQIVLVGDSNDIHRAEQILAGENFPRVLNYAGKTKLTELFSLAHHSKLVVGCDSLWMHVGSLAGTPCYNFSFETVNFWETGPWNEGSEVFYAGHEHSMPSDRIADDIHSRLCGNGPNEDNFICDLGPSVTMYRSNNLTDRAFEWQMIKGLYLGEELPPSPNQEFDLSIIRLAELTALALEQIDSIRKDQNYLPMGSKVLNNVDQLVEALAQSTPLLQPMVRWFQTNKTQVPPGEIDLILFETEKVFAQLSGILGVYLNQQAEPTKEQLYAKY